MGRGSFDNFEDFGGNSIIWCVCVGGGGCCGLVVFYWGHFSHFEGLLVFWSFRERERERFLFGLVFIPGKKKKTDFYLA